MADKIETLNKLSEALLGLTNDQIIAKCKAIPNITTIPLEDCNNKIIDVYVTPAIAGYRADLFEFVKAARDEYANICTLPVVREMPRICFQQFVRQNIDGSLMNSNKEIWLNTDANINADYFASVYVHEATHFCQQELLNWDDLHNMTKPEILYDEEFEAFSVQRKYLQSVGSRHPLTEWSDGKLRSMIVKNYEWQAKKKVREYAAERARMGER